jgi:hypothetical protein
VARFRQNTSRGAQSQGPGADLSGRGPASETSVEDDLLCLQEKRPKSLPGCIECCLEGNSPSTGFSSDSSLQLRNKRQLAMVLWTRMEMAVDPDPTKKKGDFGDLAPNYIAFCCPT